MVHYVPSLADAQDTGKTLFLSTSGKAFVSADGVKKIRVLSQIPEAPPKALRVHGISRRH